MAGAADTARLIASLELMDKGFSAGITKATGGVGKLQTSLGKIGGIASKGVGTAVRNIEMIGAAAVAAVGAAVYSGLATLKEREGLLSTTAVAIKNAGLAGKVAATDVLSFAQSLETAIGSAYEYTDIQAAANTLLIFGKTSATNYQRATTAAVDLGAAMRSGPTEGAKMLAKALADPLKGMTNLRRAGVVLDATQQANIKTLMQHNKLSQAQALLLTYVEQKTKGAALASQGPYAQALAKLADASRDAKAALAEGLLPVITKVANIMTSKLGDPRVIAEIRSFGNSLAGAFDKALAFASGIDWTSIRDAMSLAGKGAKAAFDMFTAMPSWVQTAVVTGWGLNKLTGGAVTGIGKVLIESGAELAKGFIKGVLGINAGVVNAKAGVVNVSGGIVKGGGGGIPGVGAGAGAGGGAGTAAGAVVGGTLAGLATITAGVLGILGAYALPSIIAGQLDKNGPAPTGHTVTGGALAGQTITPQQFDQWTGSSGALKGALDANTKALYFAGTSPTPSTPLAPPSYDAAGNYLPPKKTASMVGPRGPVAKTVAALDHASMQALGGIKAATTAAAHAQAAAATKAAGATAAMSATFRAKMSSLPAAIATGLANARPPSVSTTVTVNVTAAKVTKSVVIQSRYGPSNGSAAGSGPGGALAAGRL